MDSFLPYRRRISRVLEISRKVNDVDKIISNYKNVLDDYLLLLYSNCFLNINFKNNKQVDYNIVISSLNQKYSLKLSSSNILDNSDYQQLSRSIIEVIDYKEFNEKYEKSLSNELLWLPFDEIASNNPVLVTKKADLFKKYSGNEQELFSLLRRKYPKKQNINIDLYRNKLLSLFKEFRPSKINQIDSLLSINEGKEEEFINRLILKFSNEKKLDTAANAKAKAEEEERKKAEVLAKLEAEKAKAAEEEAKRLQLAANAKAKAEEERQNAEAQAKLEAEKAKAAEEEAKRLQLAANAKAKSEEEEREKVEAIAKLEAEKAKAAEEEAKKLELAENAKAKTKEEESKKTEDDKAELDLQSKNKIKTELWNGLKVPIISAKSVKEANLIASEFVGELPFYNGKKIFKWNGKLYAFKSDEVPKKPKKSKPKKPISKKNIIVIGSLLVVFTLGVLFFLFKDSIIPISTQPVSITEADSISRIDEIAEDTIHLHQESDVIAKDEDYNTSDGNSLSDEIESNDINTSDENHVALNELESSKEIVKTIAKEPVDNSLKYHLIAGSFSEEPNAIELLKELKVQGYEALFLGKIGEYYKVSFQSFSIRSKAEKVRGEMIDAGTFTWIQDYSLKQ